MPKQKYYSAAEKLFILQELDLGLTTVSDINKTHGIHHSTLDEWRLRYKMHGIKGLEIRTTNKTYSEEVKGAAVQDYLSGICSQREISAKYNINSHRQLRDWVKKYNGHSSFNFYEIGGEQAMTKGRPTTWKERIDIVLHCLSHNYDYKNTAAKFQVSYQQVYQWVHKYENNEPDALKDGRGRKKSQEELNDADRQNLAMKKLEYENERLRAENALLKKLQELEGRRF